MTPSNLYNIIRPVLILLTVIWIIEIVNQMVGHRLNTWFGLEPRKLDGLIGVPAMPFLHGGFGHLGANSLPLLVLGGIGVFVARERIWISTIWIVLTSGLAVWLLARGGTVVGASGLIFGWFGFLVTLGAIERSFRAVAGAVLVIAIYGGMIWGVLPQSDVQISWEAHFFGAIAGVAAAWMFARRRLAK